MIIFQKTREIRAALSLKKQRLKITQLEKVSFIKMNELKSTQVELFSFSHFMPVAVNAFELFCIDHLANNEHFLYHSNLSFQISIFIFI